MKPVIEWTDTTPQWRREFGERRFDGLVFDGAFAVSRVVLDLRTDQPLTIDRLDDASVLLRDDVVAELRAKIREMTP